MKLSGKLFVPGGLLFLILAAIIGLRLTTTSAVGAVSYTLVDIGTFGGTESLAGSINASDLVVGEAHLPGDADFHTFYYTNGVLVDLSPINYGDLRSGSLPKIYHNGQIASGFLVEGVVLPAIYDINTRETTVLGSLSSGTLQGFSGFSLGINDL